MSEYVIETHDLTKAFGNRCVVNAVDLRICKGCVTGFLGRNGAGKSTTIRMLMGLLRTRGESSVLGEPSLTLSPAVRARIGYLSEGHTVPGWMTVAELERFQRSFFRRWNDRLFAAVLEHFRLTPGMRAKDLSRGQRTGLALAATLAPEPEMLVLDDPALGLDPVARQLLVQAMIYVTRHAGQTILFSSHMLADVERVADRLVVIDAGVIRADCALDTFRERICRISLTFAGAPPPLPPIPGLLGAMSDGRRVILTIANYGPAAEAAIAALGPTTTETVPLSLEEAFIDYVSRQGAHSLLVSASRMAYGGNSSSMSGAF